MRPVLVAFALVLAALAGCDDGGEHGSSGGDTCGSLKFGEVCITGDTLGHCFLRVGDGPMTDLICYPDSTGGVCDSTRCGLPCAGGVCLAVGGDLIPAEPSCVDLRVLRHGDLVNSCAVVMGWPCLPGDACDTGTCYPSEPGFSTCSSDGAGQVGDPCTKWNDCIPGAVCLFDEGAGEYFIPCAKDYACVDEDTKCVHCNSNIVATGQCYAICWDVCDVGDCADTGLGFRVCVEWEG